MHHNLVSTLTQIGMQTFVDICDSNIQLNLFQRHNIRNKPPSIFIRKHISAHLLTALKYYLAKSAGRN